MLSNHSFPVLSSVLKTRESNPLRYLNWVNKKYHSRIVNSSAGLVVAEKHRVDPPHLDRLMEEEQSWQSAAHFTLAAPTMKCQNRLFYALSLRKENGGNGRRPLRQMGRYLVDKPVSEHQVHWGPKPSCTRFLVRLSMPACERMKPK